MKWQRAVWVLVAGLVLACGEDPAMTQGNTGPGPGGTGGGGGGSGGSPGGSGGGGDGGTGGGGTGGVVTNPYDPDWGACELGPPRRPANGTWLQNPEAPFQMPALQTDIEQYAITMPAASLAELFDNPREDTMFAGSFDARGEHHEVLVRFRGNSSRGWPKKSWRIELPDGSSFDGRRKLNLISEFNDCTMMVEKLGYDLLAALGFPAPKARFVRLTVNGVNHGVYLDQQRVDKDYVRDHGFADADPDLYRCGRKDCEFKMWMEPDFQHEWDKKTNELEPTNVALDQFLCAVNTTPEPEIVEVLEERLELELHLRNMVVDALIANDTVEDSRSYVFFDAFTGRMTYVPWDLNNSTTVYTDSSTPGATVAKSQHPLFLFTALDAASEHEFNLRKAKEPLRPWHPMSSNLNNRIAFNPELRARLLARMQQALDQVFKPEVLDPWFDQVHALLDPHVAQDPYVDQVRFDDGPRYMKQYVRNRIAFLETEMARVRSLPQDLVLEAVDPASGTVTLRNRSTTPVNTGTAVLTTNIRKRPLVANVPSQMLSPGQTLQVKLSDLGLTLGAPGEVAVFANTHSTSIRDLLYVGKLAPGQRFERDAAGAWQLK